jgi:ATP-dependent DNA ligase
VFIGHRRQPGGVVDLHLTRHQKGADFHVRRRLRLAHFRNHCLAFYAFDLIELNGDDLRRDPLEVRKATLASSMAKLSPATTTALPRSTVSATDAMTVTPFSTPST